MHRFHIVYALSVDGGGGGGGREAARIETAVISRSRHLLYPKIETLSRQQKTSHREQHLPFGLDNNNTKN